MSKSFTLRPARRRDARAIAGILRRWIAATEWFETQRPASASVAAMRGLIDTGRVWVAVQQGFWPKIIGVIALQGEEIAALYVDAHAQGQGIGAALLAQAQAASPSPLRLATFQANAQARAFYARMGFVELARTAGDNEEGLPDIRLLAPWPDESPAL